MAINQPTNDRRITLLGNSPETGAAFEDRKRYKKQVKQLGRLSREEKQIKKLVLASF